MKPNEVEEKQFFQVKHNKEICLPQSKNTTPTKDLMEPVG